MIKAILAIFFTLTAFNIQAANIVETVRVGEKPTGTRIVFEAAKGHDVDIKKVFKLTNPPRLVVDMPSTNFKYNTKRLDLGRSNIKEVREGIFNRSTHRVVIDLNREFSYKYFTIGKNSTKGERLVLDISPDVSSKVYSIPTKAAAVAGNKIAINANDIKSDRKKKFVVMIDPGHGGVDPGAVGKISRKKSVYEKTITLQIAKKLQKEINRYPNMTAYLTRSTDVYVPLRTRIKRATKQRADLFISIHADAHENTSVRGGSVYILSENSSDKEAARLARIANRGDEVAGVILKNEARDIQSILIDLTQRESMNKSALLAQDVLKYMKNVVLVKHTKAKFAGFVVLKSADIPSILVESSYISNPTDRAILMNDRKQSELAKAIAKGTYSYLMKNY